MTGLALFDDSSDSRICYPLVVQWPPDLINELRKRATDEGCPNDIPRFAVWLGVLLARSLPGALAEALERENTG